MQVVSLFSGCGGLDLGFHQAGFQVGIYAYLQFQQKKKIKREATSV